MQLKAYSIYDRKALQYHPPFFQSTDGQAARAFADLANDPQTTVGRHPGDYQMYLVGLYDDQSGALAPVFPIVHIVDALALVEAKQSDFFRSMTGEQPAANGEDR